MMSQLTLPMTEVLVVADCWQNEPDAEAVIEAPEDLDEPDEATLSDAEFYKSLRASIAGVRAGIGQSIADAAPKAPQQRPHSKRWRPRDRRGSRIY